MSDNNKMNEFRIAILTDGSSYGCKVIKELAKLNLSPDLIVKEARSKSILKRIEYRKKKYGWGPTLLWFFESIRANLKLISTKENDFDFPSTAHVLQVDSVNSDKALEQLIQGKYDLIINTVSSIIPSEVLKIPRYGILGAHPGILPKYVGLSSIHWQVYDGIVPGFTIFQLTNAIDSGSAFVRKQIPPLNSDSFINYCKRFKEMMIIELSKFCLEVSKRGLPPPLPNRLEHPLNRGLISLVHRKQFKRNWKKLTRSPEILKPNYRLK